MLPQRSETLPANAADESPSNSVGQQWYAVYTCAHHERRIAEQFVRRSVEQFLPFYETVRRWKDRKVRLQLPLFPSYVFVRIDLTEQMKILQVPGVVRLVSFNGKPAALPEAEIAVLRCGLSSGLRAEPYPYIEIGRAVRVKSGPLCGLMGKLVRRKDNYRIVISVDSINRSIICEVSLEDIDLNCPAHLQSRRAVNGTSGIRQGLRVSSGGGVV